MSQVKLRIVPLSLKLKLQRGILPAPEDLTQNLAVEQGAAH